MVTRQINPRIPSNADTHKESEYGQISRKGKHIAGGIFARDVLAFRFFVPSCNSLATHFTKHRRYAQRSERQTQASYAVALSVAG
jgi:hypothetical protein